MAMKRLLIMFLCLLLTVSFVSCSGRRAQSGKEEEEKAQQGKKDKEEKLEKGEGKELVDSYIRSLIVRDQNIDSFYSEGMLKASQNYTPLANPHPNGYKIGALEEKEGKLEGTVQLFSVFTGKPYFSSDESKITVIKEKGSYVIDKIEKKKTTEVNEKDNALILREDGDVQGKEIIKIDELPGFGTPQGARPDQKFTIGRDGFGPVALDPEGKNLALSTRGTYPAVIVLDIEKKQAKPLDLYFEENIQSICWSQDGKYLAVEMANSDGTRFIYIYDSEKGEKIDDPMKDALPQEKFTIDNPFWTSESEIIFNVSGVSNLSPEEQKRTGSYKFDVKNVTLTKQ